MMENSLANGSIRLATIPNVVFVFFFYLIYFWSALDQVEIETPTGLLRIIH
jgi:hypothetical protein